MEEFKVTVKIDQKPGDWPMHTHLHLQSSYLPGRTVVVQNVPDVLLDKVIRKKTKMIVVPLPLEQNKRPSKRKIEGIESESSAF